MDRWKHYFEGLTEIGQEIEEETQFEKENIVQLVKREQDKMK